MQVVVAARGVEVGDEVAGAVPAVEVGRRGPVAVDDARGGGLGGLGEDAVLVVVAAVEVLRGLAGEVVADGVVPDRQPHVHALADHEDEVLQAGQDEPLDGAHVVHTGQCAQDVQPDGLVHAGQGAEDGHGERARRVVLRQLAQPAAVERPDPVRHRLAGAGWAREEVAQQQEVARAVPDDALAQLGVERHGGGVLAQVLGGGGRVDGRSGGAVQRPEHLGARAEGGDDVDVARQRERQPERHAPADGFGLVEPVDDEHHQVVALGGGVPGGDQQFGERRRGGRRSGQRAEALLELVGEAAAGAGRQPAPGSPPVKWRGQSWSCAAHAANVVLPTPALPSMKK
ncbi:hypothetical protein ACFQV2_17685 [Actinokineospora soli]|uniref:Uncharacterized protein n=1 Tax=Actinokineospora soli TaxID=1048753 RepID=A0ABW2TPI4_9PSEU